MAEKEGGSNNTKKVVMIAIDESECSHYALMWVLESLRECITTSPLLIFTAQPIPDFGYIQAASLGYAPPELISSIHETQKKVSMAILDKAKTICASQGVIAETIIEVGDPKETICSAIQKFDINLLVLGSHGRGVLKRAFLGSVSNYCVHNAKYPVLVVKKPE